ncbi:hypothetical protein ACV30Q_10145 [Clostridium perfringens]|nr:hypothetical protein [Clostridium perfringens]MDK0529833.1 hypothetical protein [Clostridium perfringens]MDK0724207.1 hypothetical protein [Clostridium perfringens]MDU4419934.1 hypothetical protein [Clostridium perfringens]MDU7458951.1 hypothetical protein [Clostridium perfringens]
MIKNKEHNKKILFICSPFFGYYKHIISELNNLGYDVDYYNDRPSENSFLKGGIKLKKELINNVIDKYFNKLLRETENKKYEKVFIVNGKIFTKEMILKLKEKNKKSKFLFYTWDSVKLYPNIKEFIHLFDKAYSFDTDDCKEIEKFDFLPLFYTKAYYNIVNTKSDKVYDIASICTVHPNRYKIIKNLFPYLEKLGIKIFSYMYINRLQYLYNKLFVNEFKKAKISEFNFSPLSETQILKIISKSNVIFDIPHSRQSGLTMRTIEALGARKKIITTNKEIKNYDFFNSNNIFILDEEVLNKEKFEEIEKFIKCGYQILDENIYSKYSISYWVNIIINEKNEEYYVNNK